MVAKALTATIDSNGCFIPTSHKLNADGYFRKRLGSSRKDGDAIEMFHRVMWKHFNGEIPDGYEVDHLCGNRACFNVEHLSCVNGSVHAAISNMNRRGFKNDQRTQRSVG
jgi:hypothetical protein